MAKAPFNEAERKAEIAELLKKDCYGGAIAPLAFNKTPFGEDMTARRELIFSAWANIQKRLQKQLLPSETLRDMLKNAHAPTRFEEIGLTAEQYYHGIRTAQLIRNRYTSLDMLYEAGLLDAALSNIVNC
jgi:glycerol-1-phosphate dehydrogenase [NAD(P)+]